MLSELNDKYFVDFSHCYILSGWYYKQLGISVAYGTWGHILFAYSQKNELLEQLQRFMSLGIVPVQSKSLKGSVHLLPGLYNAGTAVKQPNWVRDLDLLNFKGEAIKIQPFPFAIVFQKHIKRKLYSPQAPLHSHFNW